MSKASRDLGIPDEGARLAEQHRRDVVGDISFNRTRARDAELVGGSSLYRDPETGKIEGYREIHIPAGDRRLGKSREVREIEKKTLPLINAAAGNPDAFDLSGDTRESKWVALDLLFGEREDSEDRRVSYEAGRPQPRFNKAGNFGYHIVERSQNPDRPRGPQRTRDVVTLEQHLEHLLAKYGWTGGVAEAVAVTGNGKATPEPIRRAFAELAAHGSYQTIQDRFGPSSKTLQNWRKIVERLPSVDEHDSA